MKFILFIILFKLTFCYSQETFTNSHDDIYIENGLFYKVKDHLLFSGDIDFIKKNGVIISKEIYKDGYRISKKLYYNKSASGRVYQETVYFQEKINFENFKFKIQKIISYNSKGEVYKIKHYDLTGDKILEEEFENGKLVYSCEFKDGKKNGKEFCSTRKCGNEIIIYLNGKKSD